MWLRIIYLHNIKRMNYNIWTNSIKVIRHAHKVCINTNNINSKLISKY